MLGKPALQAAVPPPTPERKKNHQLHECRRFIKDSTPAN